MAEANAPDSPLTDKLNPDEIESLRQLYCNYRYERQINFYKLRIDEYDLNSSFTFYASAGLLLASGFLSTLNVSLGPNRWLSVIATVLPALAALLGAFNQIYDWDRQTKLYLDASDRLLALPQTPAVPSLGDEAAKNASLFSSNRSTGSPNCPQGFADMGQLQSFVRDAEAIFGSEGDQWGQSVSEAKAEIAANPPTKPADS